MDWLFGGRRVSQRSSSLATARQSFSSATTAAAEEETLPLATAYQEPIESKVLISTGPNKNLEHVSKQRQQDSSATTEESVSVYVPSPQQHDKQQLPHISASITRISEPKSSSTSSTASWKAAAFGITNLTSVVAIVFANKLVLYTHGFGFAVTLTWLHTVFTAVGMLLMAAAGVFEVKRVSKTKALPVAAVYVGTIVLNNLSIKLNTVGFYQISKIAITPVIVAIEYLCFSKVPSARILASIVVLLTGIALATVTDGQVASRPLGMLVAAVNVVITGLYQVWAGSKQKELGLNGLQLLHQVSPLAVGLLLVLIPFLEPVGWFNPGPGTILGFHLTPVAAFWIIVSSALGLVVTLSTFLFIGATSSLTYNVVGHLKTILIVSGGVLIFGDSMVLKKLAGLCIAMTGIMWYSHIKLREQDKPAAKK